MLQRIEQSSFSGPLPPPEILERYNNAVPNGADRILAMAEQQASHRQALETIVIQGGARRANWGLGLGFVIAVVGLLLAAWLVDRGHGVEGTILGGVDLTALVGTFVYARHQQVRELDKKSEPFRRRLG